jgi:hypothetical protein
VGLKGGNLEELVKRPVGSINTGVKNPSLCLFKMEVAVFKGEVTFQILQRREIPGEF